MTRLFFVLTIALVTSFIACKPAAEDREKMHANANRISDSIGRVIDAALDEVKIQPAIATDTTKK